MNFSGSFIFIAAALVVFAQQSEAGFFSSAVESFKDVFHIGNKYERETIAVINESSKQNQAIMANLTATNNLQEAYINGTKLWARVERTILDGIREASKLILENPEAATKILNQALEKSQKQLFEAGPPVLKAIGEALGLSNDAARPGLNEAMQFFQKAGFSTLDSINRAQNLANQGLAAGGKAAKDLLEAMKKIVEGGFAGSFNLIQKSIKLSDQTLRDAQRKPVAGQVKNVNCQITATNDSVILNAIKDVNEVAIKALTRGANPVLVQKFRQVLLCELNEIGSITADGRKTVENLNLPADSDRSTVKKILDKQEQSAYDRFHNLNANIILVIASVGIESGNQHNNKIVESIHFMEGAKAHFVLGIRTIGGLIIDGLTYGDDSLKYAKAGAILTGDFAQEALTQSIGKCADSVLSVI